MVHSLMDSKTLSQRIHGGVALHSSLYTSSLMTCLIFLILHKLEYPSLYFKNFEIICSTLTTKMLTYHNFTVFIN